MERADTRMGLGAVLARHRYGLTLFAFLCAAVVTGLACVAFMRAFEFAAAHRFEVESQGASGWILSPLLFLLSIELVRRLAPCAAGTGIPQAIFAARHMSSAQENVLAPLASPRTLAVKIASLLLAVAAGASTGREGPTVHIAACVFLLVLAPFRRFAGVSVEPRSAVVAGGAAGLAAAFNTPLAGVTFAIEELTGDYFSSIKEFVLMAIIVAGIAAQHLYGDYAYFGALAESPAVPIPAIILIGVSAGALGALFSESILRGQEALSGRLNGVLRYALPPVFLSGILLLARCGGKEVMGPGNGAAQFLTAGGFEPWVRVFPLAKMAATLLTYWSGVAGGIFAPCLSIGSALGADIGQGLGVPAAGCAMVGMAAFLSGTIQAPMTAFVIIFEMTRHHSLLLPIMLATLLAVVTARLLGARHLYQTLADNYHSILGLERKQT